MPKIVPADRGEARVLEERLEGAVDYVLSVQRGTLACGENEIRLFVGTCPQLLLKLVLAHGHDLRREGKAPNDIGS
jgi:hypothetical protein